MAVKTRQKEGMIRLNPLIFQAMDLAHEYCSGRGLELGAAAHNPFYLGRYCFNVAPFDENDPDNPDTKDYEFYVQAQVALCGEYAVIDHVGTAVDIPVEDGSQNYVISSHVLEHEPNFIASLIEQNRVVKDGGIVFFIVPNRNALPADQTRDISTLDQMIEAYQNDAPPDASRKDIPGNEFGRGHYWVFDVPLVLDVIEWCNDNIDGFEWEVVKIEEKDSKVGNGHTFVCKVTK